MSDEELVERLPASIDIPDGGKLVVACCLPERLWAIAADLPSCPPRKGRWQFTVEDVPLKEAVAKYHAWLAEKREKGQVP